MVDRITDVRGIKLGQWTATRSATGCTVVRCDAGAIGGVDVRGAAPGTRETDLLRPDATIEEVHAVLLSGGSAFGLDAATGVVRYLEEQGVGLEFSGRRIPIVPAAVLFDLGIGTDRRPGAAEGYRAAARATAGAVAQGCVGAGTGATVAKSGGPHRRLKGGLGTASETLDTGVVVGAVVAVNAVGSIADPATGEIVAAPREDRGRFVDLEAMLRTGRSWRDDEDEATPSGAIFGVGENTTLGVVATNARLTKALANRLATVCQDGFARSIWPAHTRGDGDAIFTLATGEIEVDPPGYGALEAMAVHAVERAVLRGVRLATGLGGVPSATEWRAGGTRNRIR